MMYVLICKNFRQQKTLDKIRTGQFDTWKNVTCYDWLDALLKGVSDLLFLFLCWCSLNIRPKKSAVYTELQWGIKFYFLNGKQHFSQFVEINS